MTSNRYVRNREGESGWQAVWNGTHCTTHCMFLKVGIRSYTNSVVVTVFDYGGSTVDTYSTCVIGKESLAGKLCGTGPTAPHTACS